jgi:hypothetical protein
MMGRTKREPSTKSLVSRATSDLGVQAPSSQDAQAPSRLDDPAQPSADDRHLDPATWATRRLSDQATSHRDEPLGKPSAERYEKTSAFLTPDQRKWLRSTARRLPDGLSASDVVRLALDQLRYAVDEGLPLADLLIARAHRDAERFEGRRNRGLPHRQVD